MSIYGRKMQEMHDVRLLAKEAYYIKFISKQIGNYDDFKKPVRNIVYIESACGDHVTDEQYEQLKKDVDEIKKTVQNY